MASHGFQFKQFFIAHDQCAMKVSTDSILFGALLPIDGARRLLDLGTGSGLLAIMLAQRTACDCQITAVELEPNAAQQAAENIAQSPWASRITLKHADVMQLALTEKFDLIFSNPPYFPHSLPSQTPERDLARRTPSHFDWLKRAEKWLAPQGKIAFILPTEQAESLVAQAPTLNLHCTEQWQIITKAGKAPKRAVVIFSRKPTACQRRQLTIYQPDNQYTPEFKALTQAFYLNG